jgi:hypothetical protein
MCQAKKMVDEPIVAMCRQDQASLSLRPARGVSVAIEIGVN